MSAFGDSLRKIRKDKNMTQDELAALLGTSKQVVSRYENGQRSPKVSVVSEYADILGVTISELTGEVGNHLHEALDPLFSPDTPAAKKLREIADALAPSESELVEIYRNLNHTGQLALLGTARGLAANPDMRKDSASKNGTA